ncbi:hypothetical protein [Haloferula sp. A504]|uniref:hypothetical protein n=1 Tax=Haloferula sp. A504 TaxID=3373601 RepID=UPI0031C9C2AC|nr:hypothetical protein [Verrucomicrobiaceae bacterium E54]
MTGETRWLIPLAAVRGYREEPPTPIEFSIHEDNDPMKHLKPFITLAAAASLSGSAGAATITFLGEDTTTGASWRTTTVTKTSAFDPNGDNIYGNDGYYVGQTALGSSNSATEAGRFVQSNPSYVSSIASAGSFFVSDNYIDFDDASQTPGASVTDVNGALYYNTGTKFSFALSADSKFVLAVLVGSNSPVSTPTSITLAQTGGSGSGTATATPAGANFGQYVFFNVDGAAGDSFDLDIVASSTTGITGIAFEAIPEPSAAVLAALGGLVALLHRRRQ